MRIPEKFYELYQVESIQIQKKFYSSKNDVIWLRTYNKSGEKKNVVVKQYKHSNWNCNKEASLLRHLRGNGLAVPEVYFKSNNTIVMEHIPGETLCDRLLVLENGQGEFLRERDMIIDTLIQWVADFHRAMKLWNKRDYTKGDMALGNFIWGKSLYGIDFENSKKGIIERDVARLMVEIWTCTPQVTQWRIDFANRLLAGLKEEIPLEKDLLKLEILQETKERCHSCGGYLSPEMAEEILLTAPL